MPNYRQSKIALSRRLPLRPLRGVAMIDSLINRPKLTTQRDDLAVLSDLVEAYDRGSRNQIVRVCTSSLCQAGGKGAGPDVEWPPGSPLRVARRFATDAPGSPAG